jgi:hypothetical protein
MTLLATPGRPAAPRRRAAALARPAAALVTVCAGLLAAACSSPAGPPHAESRPGASRLPGGSHPAPSVVPSTTPAARSPHPGGHHSAAPAPAPTSAPAPATSSAPAPAPTGTVAPAPLAQCSTGALRISLGPAGATAGSLYYSLAFTNVSGTSCSLYGYPGVSFVSGPGGAQLGGPAARDTAAGPALVTLAPGASAHAAVQVEQAQNYPAATCQPVTAHWLRVYPPGQFAPLYADLTALTCTGAIPGGTTLGIYAVTPGATGS